MRVSREQILGHAIRIFAREGFAGATFQAIADACKVTQPAIFHYFSNKEELILASIEQMAKGNYATVSLQFDPEDDAYLRLYKHCMGNLVWGIRFKDDASLLLLLYYFAGFNEKFSKIYAGLLEHARARILEHLLAGKREKIFTLSQPAERLAERLHDQLLGHFVNLLSTARAGPRADQEALRRASELLNSTFAEVLGYSGTFADVRSIKVPSKSDETKT